MRCSTGRASAQMSGFGSSRQPTPSMLSDNFLREDLVGGRLVPVGKRGQGTEQVNVGGNLFLRMLQRSTLAS